MESITFKSRQQFLSEFFNKDRVDLLSALRTKKIINYRYRNNVPFRDEMIFFNIDAEVTFKKSNDELHIPFKNYINLLKPFIYFLYSLSKHEKFLKDCILYIHSLNIRSYVFDQPDKTKFCGNLFFPDLEGHDGFNFLNSFTISDFTKGINEININLSTYYMNITEIEFVKLGGLDEDIKTQLKREREQEREREREREQEREQERESDKHLKELEYFLKEKQKKCLESKQKSIQKLEQELEQKQMSEQRRKYKLELKQKLKQDKEKLELENPMDTILIKKIIEGRKLTKLISQKKTQKEKQKNEIEKEIEKELFEKRKQIEAIRKILIDEEKNQEHLQEVEEATRQGQLQLQLQQQIQKKIKKILEQEEQDEKTQKLQLKIQFKGEQLQQIQHEREQLRQIQYEREQLLQEKQQLQLIRERKQQEQQRREQLQREAEEALIQRLQRQEQRIQEEHEQLIQQDEASEQRLQEEQRQRIIINTSECFKSEECVICYTNPPNVLFCNCGHICFCSECEKLRNTNICPICKIVNENIRVLN